MEFYASWGKHDCERPGRRAKKATYDIIRFEADSLTAAKSHATRKMKSDARMARYLRTELDGIELAPPRWEKWSAPIEAIDAPGMLRTMKKSEGMDYPIMYVNPENDPGDQHPGHYGWLSLTWTPPKDSDD